MRRVQVPAKGMVRRRCSGQVRRVAAARGGADAFGLVGGFDGDVVELLQAPAGSAEVEVDGVGSDVGGFHGDAGDHVAVDECA